VWQTPSWGTDFKIESLNLHPYADNRHYSRIRTTKILDRYDNQVPDGTLITFNVKDQSKVVGSYKAMTIDGIANVYIKNPGETAKWKIQAHIDNRSFSNTISLKYKQNLKSIAHNYDSFTNTLTVGPLNSVLGQYIPDGTVVSLSIDELTVTKECLDGFAIFPLLDDGITNEGPALISVGGLKKEIVLN